MQEAVESLRDDFGSDAVILHTTQKRRWFFGRIGPRYYEVLGAFDPSFRQQASNSELQAQKPAAAPEQRRPVSSLEDRMIWSDSIRELYRRLVARDIPKDLAQELIRESLSMLPQHEWNNVPILWKNLQSVITRQIITVEPWQFDEGQKIVTLIGPTGVGKTTTIAKLAANFALVSGRNVGLITVDTYRIAAVEQLRTYAEIIGVPLEVAYNPRELRNAVTRLHDRDLILIDTAGRSQNNYLQMAELKTYLEGIDVEIHLVVSATTKVEDVNEIIRIFGQLSVDRVIITKLDETNSHGVILHSCVRAGVPLAFVTNGQGVPEDIEVACAEKLAQLILGDS